MRPPAPPRGVSADRPARPSAATAGRDVAPTTPVAPARQPPAAPEPTVPAAAAAPAAPVPGEGWTIVESGAAEAVTTRFAERLAERVGARRRLLRVRLAVLVAAGLLVAGLAYLVLFSPVLSLRAEAVTVEGTGPYVDPAAVTVVATSLAGVPLARVDVGALEDRIGRLEGIRSVDVSRAWPGGLDVVVVPREPVAAAPVDGGFVLLDADGVRVTEVGAVPEGLPTVDVPADDGDAAHAVVSVLGALSPELLREVARAGADSPDTVGFTLHDGTRVEWGSAESSALKLRVLEVLRQRPASVYDVSAPTMPVTR